MKILVLPGEGTGPDIATSTLDILRAADERLSLKLSFETMEIGLKTLRRVGTTLPADVMERIPQTDGVILGPVSHYEYPARDEGGINPSGELRVKLELYANIRPCFSRADLTILRKPMGLVMVGAKPLGFFFLFETFVRSV